MLRNSRRQRGVLRPQDFTNTAIVAGGNDSDIGAYEVEVGGEAPVTIKVADAVICIHPIQNNVLIGNPFVNTPQFLDNYNSESFWADSRAVTTVSGNTATLFFDQLGYDAVPKQFALAR